jgi:hypothetical protein
MKNDPLLHFLKLHLEANSIVLRNKNVCELISYNNCLTIEKYQEFIDATNQEASFIYGEKVRRGNGDCEKYLKILQLKFKNALPEFIEHQGFLIHKRLDIRDKLDNKILFDDLTTEVEQKISEFISIQKSSLTDFIIVLDLSGNQFKSNLYTFDITKTDVVEISNAFVEGGYVISENGPVVKKEFINYFAAQFGIKIDSPEKILYKAMQRENPSQFMDKLKRINTDYCEKDLS